MQKITKRYSKPYSKRYAGGFNELKATHNLVLCGLMAALAVVLYYAQYPHWLLRSAKPRG